MIDEFTGTVRGNTIALDGPVPPLEGRRVRVILEPLSSEETAPAPEEQERLLLEWAEKGPKGPLDAEVPWPDERSFSNDREPA